MALKVVSTVNKESTELRQTSTDIYQGNGAAPEFSAKTTEEEAHYPVTISVSDDAGNTAVNNSTLLTVRNGFSFDFIAATPNGEELGYLDDEEIDVDVGTDNDFELTVPMSLWDEEKYGYENLIYIPDTEYGGIIEERGVKTASNSVLARGYTWRGLLTQKIVEPPEDADNLVLNGELNAVIRELVGDQFGELFTVSEEDTGVQLKNWIVDRYATLYDTIIKFLNHYGYRLQIEFKQGEGSEPGKVRLHAVPVMDYSEQLEYSEDCDLDFDILDYRRGINHLICAGGGEGTERIIIHLYVQEDGSVGKTRYYKELYERVAFYDYGNAEDEAELEEKGIERLKELQNYKKFSMDIDNIDLEIGDIVGGREYITEMEMKKPVAGKIFRKKDGKVSIEYKLKGED